MTKLRVLIAEDHAVVREGTRQVIERDPDIDVVGEAADGVEAVELALRLNPDVTLLDIHMPQLNGIEATRQITTALPEARVLILSAYDDEDYVSAALDAGAGGYLLKSAHGHEVIAAIRSVSQGQVVMDARIARLVLRRRTDSVAADPSPRELDVLRLAARGLRTKEIAAELATSPRTVEAHFTSIYNRFGVTTRAEAVLHAAARGWIRHAEGRPRDAG